MAISKAFLLSILSVTLLFALALSLPNALALNLGNVALMHVALQQNVSAADSAKHWLGFGVTSGASFRSLTRLYLALGDSEKAIQAGERAVALKPGDLMASYWLGQAYWVAGQREAAREVWRRSPVMQAKLARLVWLCWHYADQGKVDAAEVALRDAIALDPEFITAYDALASLMWGRDWAKVAWALDQALSYSSEGTAAWYWNKGRQYILHGDWVNAATALRASVKLEPTEWSMRFLADALEHSGNQTEAKLVRQAIEVRWGK